MFPNAAKYEPLRTAFNFPLHVRQKQSAKAVRNGNNLENFNISHNSWLLEIYS